ncbi:hypothetical protein EXN66_Car020597 [Channa argus]|uniref:Uncharacterized protein n=1 Tax=Channa argus TaxID=215402 RepID=A0A6G1QR14_CHAAH|nr:hypothetical protein EXN66_Car020597 [Channa argus]
MLLCNVVSRWCNNSALTNKVIQLRYCFFLNTSKSFQDGQLQQRASMPFPMGTLILTVTH